LPDPQYNRVAAATYASTLREQFLNILASPTAHAARQSGAEDRGAIGPRAERDVTDEELIVDAELEPTDVLAIYENRAIEALRNDEPLMERIRGGGAAWGAVKAFFKAALPETLDDLDGRAYQLVRKALDEIFGPQNEAWHAFKNQNGVMYVKVGRKP